MPLCLVQDRGEAPADLGYDQVLAGLQLISALAAAQLFDALLTWRKASLKLTSTQQSDQIAILRKRVSLEGDLTALYLAPGKGLGNSAQSARLICMVAAFP